MPPRDDIDALQGLVSTFIKKVRQVRGWSQNQTAQKAEVSKTTIGRNENPPDDYRYVMSTTSLRKLSKASGIPLPQDLLDVLNGSGGPMGFAEEVNQLFDDAVPPELEIETADQSVWEIQGRGLEMLGYMPGDMVKVDRTVAARAGDAVCAQIVDEMRGTAETVFRAWRPPYLVTETWDPAAKRDPLAINPDNIVGPVVLALRVRKGS